MADLARLRRLSEYGLRGGLSRGRWATWRMGSGTSWRWSWRPAGRLSGKPVRVLDWRGSRKPQPRRWPAPPASVTTSLGMLPLLEAVPRRLSVASRPGAGGSRGGVPPAGLAARTARSAVP